MPPDLRERYKIYIRERFTWFGQEPELPEVNSSRGKVLIEASYAWADQLPEPDRERVYKAVIKAVFSAVREDMIEKGELVSVGNDRVKLREDATPAELTGRWSARRSAQAEEGPAAIDAVPTASILSPLVGDCPSCVRLDRHEPRENGRCSLTFNGPMATPAA
jgi:hypothetical protein